MQYALIFKILFSVCVCLFYYSHTVCDCCFRQWRRNSGRREQLAVEGLEALAVGGRNEGGGLCPQPSSSENRNRYVCLCAVSACVCVFPNGNTNRRCLRRRKEGTCQLVIGTWPSGQIVCASVPKVTNSCPSGGSESTFSSDFPFTARGSNT